MPIHLVVPNLTLPVESKTYDENRINKDFDSIGAHFRSFPGL